MLQALLILAALAQDDWIPLKEGVRWTYRRSGPDRREPQEFAVEVVGRGRIGQVECFLLQWRETDLVRWLVADPEGYRVIREGEAELKTPRVWLRRPLEKGGSWDTGEGTATVAAVDEPVEVPAGKFRCVRLEISAGASRRTRWFARGVGCVKEADAGTVVELVRLQHNSVVFVCEKCRKESGSCRECCGAYPRLVRKKYTVEAPECRCAVTMGAGRCVCNHCEGEKDSRCYCDSGGCECGVRMRMCQCLHCTGCEGGDDGLGNCRCSGRKNK